MLGSGVAGTGFKHLQTLRKGQEILRILLTMLLSLRARTAAGVFSAMTLLPLSISAAWISCCTFSDALVAWRDLMACFLFILIFGIDARIVECASIKQSV